MLFKNNGEALFYLLAAFWYIRIPAGGVPIYFGMRWLKHTHFLGLKVAASPVAKGKGQLTETGKLKEGCASKSFSLFDQKIPEGAFISL